MRRGLIRIEADEASYNLHIILRFELEQRIMDGLDLRELPDVWNESMSQYLGVDVPNDAVGVLQDVHWSRGGFGYFPTYSLGNVISVQIWERLREDVDDVDEQIARGEFSAIREWLRENVHRHGRKFTPGRDARARGRRADRPRAVPRATCRGSSRSHDRARLRRRRGRDRLVVRRAPRAQSRRCRCSAGGRSTRGRLNAHGLRVSGKADLSARVVAAVSAAELPEPDLVDRRDEGARARGAAVRRSRGTGRDAP